MNCKPGDLAYVVVGTQARAVVTVEKMADPFPDGSPALIATSREKLKTRKRLSRMENMNNRFRIRDSWLRPITGIPVDEEVTEDLKETA